MSIRIILFDDDEKLRASMKILLKGVEGYEVAGDFGNCENADKIVDELEADVVIMDIDMPKINGIEGLQLIKKTKPELGIIMHTVFEDDQRLFDSLCAGASGYLLKNSSFIQLLEAIEDVQNGGAPMSPSIAKKVLQSFQRPLNKNKYGLSKKELEVLQHLVKGFSYKMISAACFISLSTVQAHIKNIYTKLHVNCGREAVVLALRDKIV
jgi:DNA-binding NarL/FixJ family response regulator